jgi:transposase-like protein
MSTLSNKIYSDENAARKHLEALRWPNGPVCPHCGTEGNATALTGKSTRPGVYKCKEKECRKPFSVTVGTVFERSKIPLSQWLLATSLLTSSKKGMSSHQLHRILGITYKSAWFMTMRIREAMKEEGIEGVDPLLGGPGTSGIVEADETYFGKTRGQGKGAHLGKKQKVVALLERNGRVRAFHVPSVNAENLKPILHSQIAKTARLMTDESQVYSKIGTAFASHETTNHGAGEYARGDVTTNTVEGYFGILKRGIKGVYQHVSPEHLHRYVNEFSFRYNTRSSLEVNDTQRAMQALLGIGGKRLTYRTVKAHA